MKKKISAIILILLLVFAFSACDKGENQAEPEKTLYEKFLAGEEYLHGNEYNVTLWLGDTEEDVIAAQDGVLISDLIEKLMATDLSKNGGELENVKYAYIDCGNDGANELALDISINTEDDTVITRQVVIKEMDGKLQLCGVLESLYRSEVRLKGNQGLAILRGSSGAASYEYLIYAFDKDGKMHSICYEDGEFFMDAYYPEGNAVANAAAQHMDEISDEDLLRIIYFIDDEGDYGDALYCAESDNEELIEQIFNEADTDLTTSSEIDQMIHERLEPFGITEITDEEPEWLDLDMDKAGLADIKKYGYNPVFVTNADEFVNAINDDTTIVLAPGTYNVTQWLNENSDKLEFFYLEQSEPKGVCYYGWDEDSEFIISHLNGLRIVSQDKENPATIVSEPRYFNVISFRNCSSVMVKDLIMGHTEEGLCSGDVIGAYDCTSFRIDGCDLYGCGAYGIMSQGSFIDCDNTVIHDCSYGCVESLNNSYLNFEDCTFKDCREYTMFEIWDSSAYFGNCTFDNLQGNMISMSEYSYANFYNCTFDKDSLNGIQNYSGDGQVNINN